MTATLTERIPEATDAGGAVMFRANRGGQSRFMRDFSHRYVALEGGWGSGKTWSAARKLLLLHIHNADGGRRKVQSVAVAPTYPLAKKIVIPELMDACEESGLGPEWRAADNEIVFPKSSLDRIMIQSAERPDRIAGWEVGAFWGDEAARWKEDRENPRNDPLTQLKGRLRHKHARILQGMFSYTNEGDHTAIYEEFHKGDPDHALYRASTADNPTVADFHADMLRQLTPELAKQYIEGSAINLRGSHAYGVFDDAVNVDETIELYTGRPLHLSLDFNINPGMHGVIGQHNETADELTAVHELHAPRLDVRGLFDMLRNLIASLGGWKWTELHVFGDATGKSEWAGTAESCYDIVLESLKHAGIPYRLRVPAANPAVTDRVNAVNVALLDLQGRAHYRIHPRCIRLINDFRKVHWGDDGKIDKTNSDLTHASDAEGYRIEYIRPVRRPAKVSGRFSV